MSGGICAAQTAGRTNSSQLHGNARKPPPDCHRAFTHRRAIAIKPDNDEVGQRTKALERT